MRNNYSKARYFVVLIFIAIIVFIAVVIGNFISDKNENFSFKNDQYVVSFLNEKQIKKMKNKIIKYLNKKNFSNFSEIIFIDKKIVINSDVYFYFYLNDNTKILIECTYSDENFYFYYLGNSLVNNIVSKSTNFSYLQIMNPDEYQKQQELNDIIENGESAAPDPYDNAHMDPNDGYSIN